MGTSQDPRCCGSGTCIIDEQGQCWCGQRWDGQKMSRPASAAAPADEASDAYASTLQGDLDSAWAPTLPTMPTDLRN